MFIEKFLSSLDEKRVVVNVSAFCCLRFFMSQTTQPTRLSECVSFFFKGVEQLSKDVGQSGLLILLGVFCQEIALLL